MKKRIVSALTAVAVALSVFAVSVSASASAAVAVSKVGLGVCAGILANMLGADVAEAITGYMVDSNDPNKDIGALLSYDVNSNTLMIPSDTPNHELSSLYYDVLQIFKEQNGELAYDVLLTGLASAYASGDGQNIVSTTLSVSDSLAMRNAAMTYALRNDPNAFGSADELDYTNLVPVDGFPGMYQNTLTGEVVMGGVQKISLDADENGFTWNSFGALGTWNGDTTASHTFNHYLTPSETQAIWVMYDDTFYFYDTSTVGAFDDGIKFTDIYVSDDGYIWFSTTKKTDVTSSTIYNRCFYLQTAVDLNGNKLKLDDWSVLAGCEYGFVSSNSLTETMNELLPQAYSDSSAVVPENGTDDIGAVIPLGDDDKLLIEGITNGIIDGDSQITYNDDGSIKDIDGMTLDKLQEILDVLNGSLQFSDIQGYLDYITSALRADAITQKAANKLLDNIDDSTEAIAADISAIREMIEELTQSADGELSFDYDIEAPLLDKFPFCLPFDLYRIFTIFVAEPVTPNFKIPLKIPAVGLDEEFVLDLSDYNWIAELVRWGVYMVFCGGLLMATNKLIGRG